MPGNLAKNYLKEYKKKSEPILDIYIKKKIKEASENGSIPKDLIKKLFTISRLGKKVRGALLVLGYKASGGKNDKAILDASIFIELFQTGLLIHDDIMDQDDLRRSLPTIHKQYELAIKTKKSADQARLFGESMAISIGDLALFLAYEKLNKSNFPVNLVNRASQVFTNYAQRVVYGQALDISSSIFPRRSESEIVRTMQLKTAEYTGELPLLIGAILSGIKDQKKIEAFKKFGTSFGWAFQISDDLLGIFGSQEKVGKPVGSDLRERKQTLLMLQLNKQGTIKQRKIKNKLFGNKHLRTTDIYKMQKLLKKSGSYDYVVSLGRKYISEGKKLIPKLTNDPDLQKLFKSFLDYTMERAY
jgi:geranylgeranyl diphosphate synthase type I